MALTKINSENVDSTSIAVKEYADAAFEQANTSFELANTASENANTATGLSIALSIVFS